jgi:hypothetical protein
MAHLTSDSDGQGDGRTAPALDVAAQLCRVTTSWDDGHGEDDRLATLLHDVGAAATFYIPQQAKYRQIDDRRVRELAASFEIGAHTITHRALTGLAEAEVVAEVLNSKAYIEGLTEIPCRMFCYPYGEVNNRVKQVVRSCGFMGARTVVDFCDGAGADAFALPTAIHACRHSVAKTTLQDEGNPGFLGAQINLSRVPLTADGCYDWAELAVMTFELVRARGGIWHVWGHSWEIAAQGLWGSLREVLQHVLRQPGVVAVTNAEVLP